MLLATDHTARCRIVIPFQPDPVTRYAAEELARWLEDVLLGTDPSGLPGEGYRYCPQADHLVFGGESRITG